MGELIYLYGLVPSTESASLPLPSMKGFDGKGEMYTISIGEITAIVSSLDAKEYSEDIIKEKINSDMEWLQEKAFHHHETVMGLSKLYTVIPLKFCTLYKNENSLRDIVQQNQSKMTEKFALLKGNEEWNLKIYCNDELLKKQVSQSNPAIEERREEISQLSKGKQFFEKKKLDKLIEEEVEKEKDRISEEIHTHLQGFVLLGNVKRNWGKDVTGRKENMTWNSVYLISSSKVEQFLEEIQQFEKKMEEMGWQFEPTGPWPAYHFSSFS
ncbi:gas vesicle protein GvpL [Bacillus sp. LL01]|uniref:GvpL/GvpF family gas vesicle protein n=1 Tax=Bacillus sp. LL01 TaxID=1665556 RepID=UPI00064D2D6A|nr:GvpL/GvpF family gas vesicle protein [Bacillus sp. LL01]KMJ57768.1 gas vesicle protein GvpL [Bacillus sp. LL01]